MFGAFYTDGSVKMVLEYMDGGSLGDILRHVKSIENKTKVPIIPESILSNISM